jgi:hypothetical protein
MAWFVGAASLFLFAGDTCMNALFSSNAKWFTLGFALVWRGVGNRRSVGY